MLSTKHYTLLLCCGLFISACKEEPTAGMVELDLMSYGMPIVIKAPENPEVRKMDLVMTTDVTVIKGDDYNVQIFESEADVRDVGQIKARLLSEIQKNPYFFAVIRDDPAGFIYESKVDSSYTNFGFRHVRIQGDKEFVFQQGLRGRFSKEAVEAMYQAVQ